MDLPSETQIRWILRRTAGLLQLGAEPVRGLVVPTPEFFPDTFDGSPQSVAALLARVQEHAGLRHVASELVLVTPEGETTSVSACSSGACGGSGRVEARGDRVTCHEDGSYSVAVSTGEIKSPVVLTTALVRAVSFMFLAEVNGFDDLRPAEREPAVDLAATLLGFGPLITNGSYIYAKGCSGVAVHSATKMPVDELTLALAIFCKLHEVPERLANRHLEVTPRAHFEESVAWAGSNMKLIRLLRSDPGVIVDDAYSLSDARSWLARKLGIGKAAKVTRATDDDLAVLERELSAGAPRKSVDAAKARRLAEIRALVDEGLEG